MKNRNKKEKSQYGKFNIIDALILMLVLFIVGVFVTFLFSDMYTGPEVLIDYSSEKAEETSYQQMLMVNLSFDYSCVFDVDKNVEGSKYTSMNDLPKELQLVAGNCVYVQIGNVMYEAKIKQIKEYDVTCNALEEADFSAQEEAKDPKSENPDQTTDKSNLKTLSYTSSCEIVITLTCETKDGVNYYIQSKNDETKEITIQNIATGVSMKIWVKDAEKIAICTGFVKGEAK
jgi:hypothetical protein